MGSSDEHYLKRELYELIQRDPSIFEFLQAGSLDGVWYWDMTDTAHEWLSPRFKEVFGYAEDEIPHTSAWWQENIHPDDLREAMDNFDRHLADPGCPYDQIVRYRHKDGSTVWVRCRGLLIRDADGKPLRMLGAHTDVTALKEAEGRLRAVLEALPDPILEIRRSGAVVRASGVAEGEAGSLASFVGAGQEAAVLAAVGAALDEGLPRTMELQAGAGRDLELRLSPTVHQTVLLIRRDISSIRAAERALQAQNEELVRRNQELDQFTYMASHDLQEPLRKLTALPPLLREDIADMGVELSEDAEMELHLIEDAAHRMTKLIQALLTLSRTGRKVAELKPLQLRPLIEDVLADLEVAIAEAEPSFVWDELPEISGDAVMLRQCYLNLISNAMKFAAPGRPLQIHLTAEAGAAPDGRTGVTLGVRDNGIGLDEAYAARAFQPFQRLHPVRDYPGTGIGLAVCVKVVEKHRGRIWVESTPGAGAHFRFFLPTIPSEA